MAILEKCLLTEYRSRGSYPTVSHALFISAHLHNEIKGDNGRLRHFCLLIIGQ